MENEHKKYLVLGVRDSAKTIIGTFNTMEEARVWIKMYSASYDKIEIEESN